MPGGTLVCKTVLGQHQHQAPRLLQNNIPSSIERKRQQRLVPAVAREVRVTAAGRHGRGAAQVPGRGRPQQEETAAANIGLERNYVSCCPPHKYLFDDVPNVRYMIHDNVLHISHILELTLPMNSKRPWKKSLTTEYARKM